MKPVVRALLAAVLAVGAFVRFRALDFGLPYTQARPDETAIIDPVRTILSGHLPHFYDYPWLFLWVVAIAYLGYFVAGAAAGWFRSIGGMLATWPTHYEPFFIIPRAISASAGTFSIAIVYRLGRQIHGPATGLVAAFFLTFTFMHVRSSHFGTTDVTMTCLILGAITLLLDAHQTRRRSSFGAAGFVAGLAAATKYNAIVLAVPMLVSHLLNVLEAPSHLRRRAWLDTGLVWFAIAFAAAFAIGVPFVVLERERFLLAMQELAHALRTGDVNVETTNGWAHHLFFSLRYGMGLPLLTTGLAGAALLFWREPRRAALFLSFPLAYYIVAGSLRLVFYRYAMPVLPFLCVTGAYFVVHVVGWMTQASWAPRAARREWLLGTATAVVALAIVGTSAARSWAFDRVLARTDSRVMMADWMSEHAPAGSTIAQSGSTFGLARFARELQYREWRWDGGRRAFILNGKRLSATDAPDWIIIQESPLPSSTQEILTEILQRHYVLATHIKAFSPSSDLVYDQQDAFFLPFTGFEHVVRPGPNFSVYRRKDAATNRDAHVTTH